VASTDLTTLQRSLAGRLIALAEQSLAKGEISEAERLYREVLHFLELVLNPEHAEIAKTLYKLAYILEFQEKNLESIELVEKARNIMRNVKRDACNIDAVFSPFLEERTS